MGSSPISSFNWKRALSVSSDLSIACLSDLLMLSVFGGKVALEKRASCCGPKGSDKTA